MLKPTVYQMQFETTLGSDSKPSTSFVECRNESSGWVGRVDTSTSAKDVATVKAQLVRHLRALADKIESDR